MTASLQLAVLVFSGYGPPVPRKIRQLIADPEKAGFINRGGKGSHRNFLHLASNQRITLSGQEGADAQPYQEKEVRIKIELSKGS